MSTEPKKPKSIKILIQYTYEDGTVRDHSGTYEQIHIHQRQGIKKYIDGATGRVKSMEQNGQGIINIVAWKGCKEPDAFVATEEIHTKD